MIATDRFVFLHLHKSGGTFVNECLLRFVPGARPLGYHLPHTQIPAPLAGLPRLGVVRDPWSYYVSWYAFQSARPQPNPLYQTLSRGRALDFAGTIRNMLELGRDPALLDAAVRALPDRYVNRGLNLPGPELARIADSGQGFYSFLFRYMFGSDSSPLIARMEQLRVELPLLLERVGVEITDPLREHLASAAPTNVSTHGPYAQYYDADLAALVNERDRSVIERFGFRFAK
jgi:hypothetical protein